MGSLVKSLEIQGYKTFASSTEFKFADTGDLVRVKGRVSTLDPRVTSQFKFTEQVQRLGKSSEIIDLTDEAGLATRVASQQLSQNIMKRISPAPVVQRVEAAVAIPKQTSKSVSVSAPPVQRGMVIQESFYSRLRPFETPDRF